MNMAALNVDDFPATAALFPIKLYRMVCDPHCQCMTWGGDGEHLVLNTRLFEDELLQQTLARWKYQLKTTSTTSFIRQLHAYGFRKVVEGFGEPNNIRRYYHPYFHRQRPDLLVHMKRNLRPSNGPKRQPFQMFDDANKHQILVSSILNQSISGLNKGNSSSSNFTSGLEKLTNSLAAGLEKMERNFPFATGSPQLLKPPGETSHGGYENLNKRRRKAPPRKHPSFEEPCEVEEEEDLSPPSMVSRLPYKGGPIPRMYPMIMGAEPFTPPPVSNVKQEGSIDLVGFQNAYSKEINQGPVITELPNVEELPKPPNTIKKQHVEKEDFPEKPKGLEIAPLKEPTSSEATKSFLVLPKPQPKKEQEKMEVDEPLDLSLPRKPKVVAVKKSLAQPVPIKVNKSVNPPQSQQLPRVTPELDETQKKQQPIQEKNTPAADNSVKQTPNFVNNKPPPPSFPLHAPVGGKMMVPGAGLPPFPMTNPRLNVPPHSVLQPAYIAWPTRGVFCPQTKQWIQSRPTIIPLPFRNQQHPPGGKHGVPTGFKLGGGMTPPFWNADSGKMVPDAKATIKTDLLARNPEEMKSPTVHA